MNSAVNFSFILIITTYQSSWPIVIFRLKAILHWRICRQENHSTSSLQQVFFYWTMSWYAKHCMVWTRGAMNMKHCQEHRTVNSSGHVWERLEGCRGVTLHTWPRDLLCILMGATLHRSSGLGRKVTVVHEESEWSLISSPALYSCLPWWYGAEHSFRRSRFQKIHWILRNYWLPRIRFLNAGLLQLCSTRFTFFRNTSLHK